MAHTDIDPSHFENMDYINLTSPHNDLCKVLSSETQDHLARAVARFVSKSFKSRQNFLDSLKAPT